MMPRPHSPSASSISTGDAARQQLFSRFHAALVRFFVRRIRVEAHAEDLAQDTLLRVLKARGFDQAQDAEKYVFRVAINQLRNYRSRVECLDHPALHVDIDTALAGAGDQRLVEDFSPERVLIGRDSLAEALRVLAGLDERTRNIFVLFKLENMRQKEIAALYGIGQSTVEKHVMKATAHLLAYRGDQESP